MKRFAIAALVIAAFAVPARAAHVTVTQIKATGSGGKPEIDKELSDIAAQLAKSFKYSTYNFLVRDSDTIRTGDTSTLTLKTGDYLDMTIDAEEVDDRGNVRHKITVEAYQKTQRGKRTVFRGTFKNPAGGTFLILLPESKAIGGTPILAIKTSV